MQISAWWGLIACNPTAWLNIISHRRAVQTTQAAVGCLRTPRFTSAVRIVENLDRIE